MATKRTRSRPAFWPEGEDAYFVESPRQGILTADGNWYRTTEDELRVFAGPVLEREGIETLLIRADTWVRAPRTTALWVFLVVVLLGPTWAALAASLGAYAALRLLGPSMGWAGPARLFRLLEQVPLQFVAYAVGLSILAFQADFGGVAAGLSVFVVFRWGLAEPALDTLLAPLLKRLYPIELEDQILRTVILKSALRLRVGSEEIDRMEKRLAELLKPVEFPLRRRGGSGGADRR